MGFPKFNQSGLLFLPARWQRVRVIRWLKRIHAWTGFWGAILFFVLGSSGFLLNHRSQMKIDTGEPVEVSAMDIAVTPGLITSEEMLGRWAQKELGLTAEPRGPGKKGGKGEKDEKSEGGDKSFLGKKRREAQKWEQSFNHVNGKVTVEYVQGAATVSARQTSNNIWGTLKNLHKGSGVGIAWILFIDTIAGALVAMSLTGFLLWTRLHGSRLVGGGIVIASLAAATFALYPAML